ncbi:hypothetical protein L7F22_051186 [Adiantum nelumboides]|nr:hypothetical protein [Adiantum nelumboides]
MLVSDFNSYFLPSVADKKFPRQIVKFLQSRLQNMLIKVALLHCFLAWSAIPILLGATSHSEAKSTTVSRTVPLHYPALYPESIAWDDGLGHFISGSLARGALFSIMENGTVDEFIRDADYSGMAATVGVIIDTSRRRILTVINNVLDHPSSFHGLAAYDLDTKARLFLAKFDKQGCPNDVTVDPNSGFAYVTDSARNLVFKISLSGESLIFTENYLFNSQPIVAVDPPAVRTGLNGITFTENYLLVVQSNSGKLFKVMAHNAAVHVVDMEKPLVAADGIRVRQDGLLVAISTDVLWVLKSRDHWRSAFIVKEVPLDRSLNSTSCVLRGPKDNAMIVHAHFQDLFTVAEKGMEGLPGGEYCHEFSLQEVQLPSDPDNDPLLLLLIPFFFLVLFGIYKLQMNSLFNKCNQLTKRD